MVNGTKKSLILAVFLASSVLSFYLIHHTVHLWKELNIGYLTPDQLKLSTDQMLIIIPFIVLYISLSATLISWVGLFKHIKPVSEGGLIYWLRFGFLVFIPFGEMAGFVASLFRSGFAWDLPEFTAGLIESTVASVILSYVLAAMIGSYAELSKKIND